MPHAARPQKAGQHKRQRDHHHHIPAQGNDQGRQAPAQRLQRAGHHHRHGGHHKPQADQPQGRAAGGHGLRVLGKQAHQRAGRGQTQHRARRHNGPAQGQRQPEDLLHPSLLPGAVVEAENGPHALHNAAGGQVQEGLKLVIDAQNHHVAVRKGGQNGVEAEHQQRGQRQIENGRHADGIELLVQRAVPLQAGPAQLDRNGLDPVHHQIHHQREHLPRAGGQGRAPNAQLWAGPQPEDEHRVQHQVGQRTAQHGRHGRTHAAHGLKLLFKGQPRHDHRRKGKGCRGVLHAHGHHRLVFGEQAQKGRHGRNAHRQNDHAVQQRKHHAVGGGGVGLGVLTRAAVQGNEGVDAHAEADGDGVDQVLHRKHQRQRRHGLLADAGHEKAVHNVIKGVYHHGNHHGQRHGHKQREYRPLFHKLIVQCDTSRQQKSHTMAPKQDHCVAKNRRSCKNPHGF